MNASITRASDQSILLPATWSCQRLAVDRSTSRSPRSDLSRPGSRRTTSPTRRQDRQRGQRAAAMRTPCGTLAHSPASNTRRRFPDNSILMARGKMLCTAAQPCAGTRTPKLSAVNRPPFSARADTAAPGNALIVVDPPGGSSIAELASLVQECGADELKIKTNSQRRDAEKRREAQRTQQQLRSVNHEKQSIRRRVLWLSSLRSLLFFSAS